MSPQRIATTAVLALAGSLGSTALAATAPAVDFDTFYIRNNGGGTSAPWDSDMMVQENAAQDGFSAATPRGGQKVGYGSAFLDGLAVNQLESVSFTNTSPRRLDRNGQPTGSQLQPYLNLWVTDGSNFAVIASENDYNGTDFANRQEWKVFEYDNSVALDWLFDAGTGGRDGSQYLTLNGTRITLDQLGDDIEFVTPITTPVGAGSGAPIRGNGFNLIFGDTQTNFIGNMQISDLTVTYDGVTTVVPEPAGAALLALTGLACLRRRRSA